MALRFIGKVFSHQNFYISIKISVFIEKILILTKPLNIS